jgi:O-antigen ligase
VAPATIEGPATAVAVDERQTMNRAARIFDQIEAFGLVVLFVGLPFSEALKSIGLALGVLGYVGKAVSGVRPRVGAPGPAIALLAFFVVAVLSVVDAPPDLKRPGALFTLALTVVPFFLVLDAAGRANRRRILALSIVVGCALASVQGFAQFLRGDEYRLALGSIENAVPAAEYLAAALVFVAALLLFSGSSPYLGPFLAFAAGAALIDLLLTKSRGPMFGAVVGTAVVLARGVGRRRYVAALLILVLMAAAWFAVLNPQSRMSGASFLESHSAAFRFSTWHTAVKLIALKPLLGHGLGTFSHLGVVYGDSVWRGIVENAHSTWINAACETGLLGAGALVAFLVLGMMAAARSARAAAGFQGAVSLGSLGAAAALVAAGFLSVTIDAEPGMLLFAILGLGQASRRESVSGTSGDG